MTGQSTGKFTGSVAVQQYKGDINVLALDMPSSPAGKTGCSGIDFRKPTDQSTPKIFLSAIQNEQITHAIFYELSAPAKTKPAVNLKITVSNATLSAKHVNSVTTGAYDDVTLTPTDVTIEWMPTKTITNYKCLAP